MDIDSEWFGLFGVVIGGGVTFITQQFRIQIAVRQAHVDKVDNDLRLFQEAVWDAINAQKVDIGTVWKLLDEGGISGLGDWLRVETYRTLQWAGMLATRIRNKNIRSRWARLENLLNQNRADVEASVVVLKRTSPDKAMDFYAERSPVWLTTSKQVREEYKSLNDAIDSVFEDLATPPSPWPWRK